MLSSEEHCLGNCLGWQIVKEENARESVSQRPTRWTQHSQESLFWTRLALFGDFHLLSFTPGMRGSYHSMCSSTISPFCSSTIPRFCSSRGQSPSHSLPRLTLLFAWEKRVRLLVVRLSGLFNQKESQVHFRFLTLQILCGLAEYEEWWESSFHRAVWPTCTDGDTEHMIWARFLFRHCMMRTGKLHAVFTKRNISMILAFSWAARRTTWEWKINFRLIHLWLSCFNSSLLSFVALELTDIKVEFFPLYSQM